jgi:hypothetical protein
MFRHVRLAAFLSLTLIACAHRPRPVETDAALGRVVIYRNGVAYFERTAHVEGDTLALSVPNERVDDLLKSLRISDARSGKAYPVSYETGSRERAHTQMLIQLPGKGPHDLRLTYVTESPAWKPTYRLELGEQESTLEALAVVDNVSGEDWSDVVIGVGSTSALSFKYDLHSVRVVERETIADDTRLGLAPPSGGSAYAVAEKELKVVANLDLGDLDAMGTGALGGEGQGREFTAIVESADAKRPRRSKVKDEGPAATPVESEHPSGGNTAPPRLAEMAQQIAAAGKRVRVEGYAHAGESDAHDASLRRANAVRDELVRNGLAEARIEVVATGRVQSGSAVRLLELDSEPRTSQASVQTGEPIGDAYFVSQVPMTLRADQSAMVSLLRAPVQAQSVYYYDPISERGSKRFAFRAVRLKNPTRDALDAGPFTVYADGKFLGEGIADPIMPGSSAFLPYALDRTLVVEAQDGTREEIESLVAIERGICRTEARRVRKTTLSLANRDDEDATVWVRHAVADGWKLLDTGREVERLRGAYLVPVSVPGGEAVELVLEEATPIHKTVDIRTDAGAQAMATWLETSKVGPELRAQIDAILASRRAMADSEQRIETVKKQMQALRQRVDELNFQLMTLRKVESAKTLRRHLAQKMTEISERLQKSTIEVTDLEAGLLTNQIELQDRVAELRLVEKPTALAKAAERPGQAR